MVHKPFPNGPLQTAQSTAQIIALKQWSFFLLLFFLKRGSILRALFEISWLDRLCSPPNPVLAVKWPLRFPLLLHKLYTDTLLLTQISCASASVLSPQTQTASVWSWNFRLRISSLFQKYTVQIVTLFCCIVLLSSC